MKIVHSNFTWSFCVEGEGDVLSLVYINRNTELFSPVLAMHSGAQIVRLCRAFVASSLITLIKENTASVKNIKPKNPHEMAHIHLPNPVTDFHSHQVVN